MAGKKRGRKYAGVYRRARSPYWWIKYTLPDGSLMRESSKTRSVMEAVKLRSMRLSGILPLAQAEKSLEPEEDLRPKTLKDFSEEYIEIQVHLRSYSTLAGRVRLLVEALGDIPMEEITARDYEKYRARRMECKKPSPGQKSKPGGCKAGTVNRDLTILKHMMRKAHSFGYVSRDAVDRIGAIKKLREEDGPTRYLSRDDEARLLEVCIQLGQEDRAHYGHLHPIVLMALRTGMRKSEILGLKWENVNLEKHVIHIVKSKSARRRDVPISDDLHRVLKAMPVSLRSDHVFWRDSTRPRAYQDVKKSFARVLKRAGISGFRFHDCRHHMASWFVMEGGNIVHLQKILGHASITMTMRYAHLAPDFIEEAKRVIDGAVGHTEGTLAGGRERGHGNPQ